MAVPAEASIVSNDGHIQGHVELAAGIAMAPGVLLGAAPGCRLVVSAGVCLGADVVVQARQGDLVLEPGVSLGSGVLVVGHGSIGQHTCVGANSTILNPTLGAAQVVAPGSLIGDPSPAVTQPGRSPRPTQTGSGDSVSGSNGHGAGSVGDVQNSSVQQANVPSDNSSNGRFTVPGAADTLSSQVGSQNGGGSTVYGKAQVNRLLTTLFPHRQALNGATPEDRP